jgi:transposase InsO family protein
MPPAVTGSVLAALDVLEDEPGLIGSMGNVGDALDNALAESLFATLQTELLDRGRWSTRQQLATAISSYIEGSYNRRRRHSALGYLSPEELERKAINAQRTTQPVELSAAGC